MTEVKTIDIDGVQWSIKDETARNKIADIEKNISVEDLPDIQITLESGYTCKDVKVNYHYKVGKIHFAAIRIENLSGNGVGTTSTIKIATLNITSRKPTYFILRDYIAPATARGGIDPDGGIYLGESNGIEQGNNIIFGEIIFAEP